MTRRKQQTEYNITVTHAAQPRFASRKEAWQTVGPILARILAKIILHETKQSTSKESTLDASENHEPEGANT